MSLDPGPLAAAFLENTGDGVLAFDRECRYTLWNPVMERISGLAAPQVVGRRAFEVFPFLVETGEDRCFHEALAGRSVTSSDRPFKVPASGHAGYFEGRYHPVRDASGAVVGGIGIIRDVTAAHELKEREESLRLHYRVLQSMREGVSVSDEEGFILYTNPAEDAMFGYAPGELVGQHVTVQNAYPPDENARIVAGVIETLKRRGEWLGEWRNRRKDGGVFVTRARITAVPSGDKQLWVCVQEDVTAEKQAEHALERSAAQLRLALEASRLAPWQWDAATDMVTLSDRAAAIFGITPGPTMRWTQMRERLHPDDRERIRLAVETAVAQRSDYDVEYRVQRAPGDEVWVAAKGRALYEGERPVGMLGVVQEITARKRSEQALLDETRAVETINTIGQMLAGELDQQKLLQALTDAATGISGAQFGSFFYNVTNDKGESYMLYTLSGAPPEAFASFPMPRNTAIFAPTFAGVGVVRIDDVTKDPRYGRNAPYKGMPPGHLPVRSYLAVPVVSRTGAVLGGLFFGHAEPGVFTARHERILAGIAAQAAIALDNAQLYKDAQDKAAALDEANRRKDQFLAMLAHELRNPLAAMRSALELISAGEPGRPVQVLERQTRALTRMVDDLLDVSRITRGLIDLKSERLDATDIARRAAEAVRPTLDARRHAFTLTPPAAPVQVIGDAVRLEQVLVNLLANAAKYTEPGGRIGVAIDADTAHVIYRVTDSGTGVTRDAQSRIFDLFEQAAASIDRAQGGLGIGLTIVRSLVERHGGRVEVESAGHGQGSTFVVRLPRAPAEGAAAPSEERARPASAAPRRILVVDDHVDSGEMLTALLASWGHDVSYVPDGPQAIDAVARRQPDVVLLDIGLPGMDGYAVATRLREMQRDRAVLVAVTGYGQEPDRTRSRDAGFDAHLVKPVDPDVLRETLDSLTRASKP